MKTIQIIGCLILTLVTWSCNKPSHPVTSINFTKGMGGTRSWKANNYFDCYDCKPNLNSESAEYIRVFEMIIVNDSAIYDGTIAAGMLTTGDYMYFAGEDKSKKYYYFENRGYGLKMNLTWYYEENRMVYERGWESPWYHVKMVAESH